jgi:hypothetical protein
MKTGMQLQKPNQEYMRKTKNTMPWAGGLIISALGCLLLAGCQSSAQPTPAPPTPAKMPVAAAPVATPAPAAAAAAAPVPVAADPTKPQPIVRIKAGTTAPFKDAEGNDWLPDQGFADGDTIERAADLKIQNTKTPALYLTERYGMTSFSYPVRNGKYAVKLHFAETYEDISGPGQRVFSFNVQGHEFKDVDVWVKAGGGLRAYVESVPVEVTTGKVQITFVANVQNPEINGLEIIPQP